MRSGTIISKVTREQRLAILAIADIVGFPVYPGSRNESGWDEYHSLIVSGDDICGFSGTSSSGDKLTFSEFVEELLKWKKPITIKLNSEYTAEIKKESKTVKVGCQTFTFEKIEELYNATKQ